MVFADRELDLAARPRHGFREALDQRLAEGGLARALLRAFGLASHDTPPIGWYSRTGSSISPRAHATASEKLSISASPRAGLRVRFFARLAWLVTILLRSDGIRGQGARSRRAPTPRLPRSSRSAPRRGRACACASSRVWPG